MAVTLDPSDKDSGSKDEKKKHGHKLSVPELIFGDLWEYDPAPETADPRIRSRYDLFIGGRFVAPQAGEYFASINPATGKVQDKESFVKLVPGTDLMVIAGYYK